MQTPYYLYDAQIINDRAAELAEAFRNGTFKLHYAVKANDNPALIKIVAKHGIGACLVTLGEMKRALAGGMKAADMLMNGVGKSEADIRFALENGIGQLNAESILELTTIADVAKSLNVKADICLRVNPEVAATTHSYLATGRRTDKFGILIEDIDAAHAIVKQRPELVWRGFSCHIGTQVHDVKELENGYRRVIDLFKEWQAKVKTFDRLDLGGGFGVSYTGEAYARPADYAILLNELAGDVMKAGVSVQLEPGRFLVAEAGTLVTKVLRVKDSGGTRFVICDAAMNNLIRPALYGAYHPINLARESAAPMQYCTIAGPVCESGDVFATERPLPGDVREGDLLHIGFAGAYGQAMSSFYNARDRVAEYLRENGQTRLIRRCITAEELDRLTLIEE